MSDRILLSQAHVTDVEESFVLDALRSGWVAPLGPHVDAFEAEVAERVGVAGALALSSGTAALHLALLAVGAREGTVVVLPSLTFAASANAIAYTGAEPVFVDSQLSDGNVDPALLLEAVDTLREEGTAVAAVMTVDLFGRCVDYDELLSGLEARDVPVVEDAAEAMGATYGGRAAGSFGVAAALSFNGNKIMTTSGGGMLLSNDLELIERGRYLSTQARQPVPWYEHTEVGYNYRMSNVLAALGRGQLIRLEEMIDRRKQIRQMYRDGLTGIRQLRILSDDQARGDAEDNAWLTVVTTGDEAGVEASSLVSALHDQHVEARHVWKPMHLQPMYAGHRAFLTGAAERLFRTSVTLPSGAGLRDTDIERVVSCILEQV